jgi:hypothetical protein
MRMHQGWLLLHATERETERLNCIPNKKEEAKRTEGMLGKLASSPAPAVLRALSLE